MGEESKGNVSEIIDLGESFDEVEKLVLGFEDYINSTEPFFLQAFEQLNKLTDEIRKEAMFSPNEDIDDIQTTNLKYLLIPYYQGDSIKRVMENRIMRIQNAKECYDQFLKLMKHYLITDTEQNKEIEYYLGDGQAKPPTNPVEIRQAKIDKFKRKKILENELTILESKKYPDEEEIRKIWLKKLNICINKALEEIEFLDRESEMIGIGESLKAKGENKNIHTQNPPPKSSKGIQFFHIPALPKVDNINMEGGNVVETFEGGKMQGMADPNIRMNKTTELKEGVFKPGYPEHTMTIAEWGEIEYQRMMENKQKTDEEEERRRVEDLKDPDSEEVMDKQTNKDRNWDDWKDMHEKGAGNKMDKRF